MRAVSVQVGGSIWATGKVLVVHNARTRAVRKSEIPARSDSAIDDCDPDPTSSQVLRPRVRSQHRLVIEVSNDCRCPNRTVGRNVRHVGIFRERSQGTAFYRKGGAVD